MRGDQIKKWLEQEHQVKIPDNYHYRGYIYEGNIFFHPRIQKVTTDNKILSLPDVLDDCLIDSFSYPMIESADDFNFPGIRIFDWTTHKTYLMAKVIRSNRIQPRYHIWDDNLKYVSTVKINGHETILGMSNGWLYLIRYGIIFGFPIGIPSMASIGPIIPDQDYYAIIPGPNSLIGITEDGFKTYFQS